MSRLDERPEVLIIGGGIIDLSIAYYLTERNFCNTRIIEKENSLTYHASGHNAGAISLPHAGQSTQMWPLEENSMKLYQDLVHNKGFDFDYIANGSIILFTKENNITLLENQLEKFRSKNHHSKADFLTSSELKEKEPNLSVENIIGAYYYPEDAQGSSVKLGQCFAGACIEKGVNVSNGTELLGFEISKVGRKRRIESVITSGGAIHPKTVVIAAGPWSGRIASIMSREIPVEPVKGHLVITPKSRDKILRTFVVGPNYYFLQSADRSIVIGGGEDSVGFDRSVIDSRVQEAWNEASLFVPIIKSLGQESKIACFRPYCADGLPIIGNSTKYDNLIFATGHFRSGFSLAPITGKIISELISDGNSSIDIETFSPARFSD